MAVIWANRLSTLEIGHPAPGDILTAPDGMVSSEPVSIGLCRLIPAHIARDQPTGEQIATPAWIHRSPRVDRQTARGQSRGSRDARGIQPVLLV